MPNADYFFGDLRTHGPPAPHETIGVPDFRLDTTIVPRCDHFDCKSIGRPIAQFAAT
jgi:hypothetical protein